MEVGQATDAQRREVATLGGGCFWCLEAVYLELEAAKAWDDPIVTEVTPLEVFYEAEDYHREYFKRNPGRPYCQVVIAPKVTKFRKLYHPCERTTATRAAPVRLALDHLLAAIGCGITEQGTERILSLLTNWQQIK